MDAVITTPVMRHLGVTDANRAAAFYRDVLGFETRLLSGDRGSDSVLEVVAGPARIRFGAWDISPDDRADRRPPGSAVVFFEIDDVDSMHAGVRARGGSPSDVARVNGINLRMFEVRDPDGHKLWFGSFDVPHKASTRRKGFERIIPELPCEDVAATASYYRDVVGFHVNYEQEDLAVMDRDEVRLLLIERTHSHTGIGSAYVYVADVDALYDELRTKGADLQGEPVSQPWGLREFRLLDPEGNRITFGQPFE